MGAISPGRWHVMHDLTKIGATSLVNVTASFSAPAVMPAARAKKRTSLEVRCMHSLLKGIVVRSFRRFNTSIVL